jgi:mono/diheme cytochrome c family protein
VQSAENLVGIGFAELRKRLEKEVNPVAQVIRAGLVIVVLTVGVSFASAQTPAAVERGQKVFTSQKCSICHSVAGVGNKKGMLDGVGTKLTADEIRQWILNAPEMAAKTKAERKPAMKAYTSLAKEDVDGLVAYLQNLKK